VKTTSEKSSIQLFVWGLLLIPAAYVSDCILDSVLFGDESLWEQITNPSYHEVAIRILFSVFILSGISLGLYFLAKASRRELLLQQQNQNLKLFKMELEEFNENMSQNLRSSSAELAATIELLRSQCDDALDEKTDFLVQNIFTAGRVLGNHAKTTLLLAEAASREIQKKKTKLDKLAHEVEAELLKVSPERQLEIKIQPHMDAWCDPTIMRAILRSLFMNAAAFIPREQRGQIEFGKLYRRGQTIYFVRDNGVGFNDGQAARIFNPFRDPKQDPELPDNTIELTSARRMVVRHGGRIWAEGVPGAGGTILFTDDSFEAKQVWT